MKRIKGFLTIEHSISLLRYNEDSHGQQLNPRILAYTLCIALYPLLSAA